MFFHKQTSLSFRSKYTQWKRRELGLSRESGVPSPSSSSAKSEGDPFRSCRRGWPLRTERPAALFGECEPVVDFAQIPEYRRSAVRCRSRESGDEAKHRSGELANIPKTDDYHSISTEVCHHGACSRKFQIATDLGGVYRTRGSNHTLQCLAGLEYRSVVEPLADEHQANG
jgi:hypothetical protein